MIVAAFLAFVALMVAAGVRFGILAARTFREANAQVNADIEFMRAIPADVQEGP